MRNKLNIHKYMYIRITTYNSLQHDLIPFMVYPFFPIYMILTTQVYAFVDYCVDRVYYGGQGTAGGEDGFGHLLVV